MSDVFCVISHIISLSIWFGMFVLAPIWPKSHRASEEQRNRNKCRSIFIPLDIIIIPVYRFRFSSQKFRPQKSHIESSFSVLENRFVFGFRDFVLSFNSFVGVSVHCSDIHRIFRGCKVIWVAAWYTGIKVLGFGFLVFPFRCCCCCPALCVCVSLCFQHQRKREREKSVVVCLLRCVQKFEFRYSNLNGIGRVWECKRIVRVFSGEWRSEK